MFYSASFCSALRRCRLLGLGDALALHLVGLPVAVLVLLRAVPLRLARRAVARRLLPARRQPAQHSRRALLHFLDASIRDYRMG